MKKQFLPILLVAAASMHADFVTSNGKKAFGYVDGQVIARPRANIHTQGVYVRVFGDAGAEKLYAFAYHSNGDHQFIAGSVLASTYGYDTRFAAVFEQEITASGLQYVSIQSLPQQGGEQQPDYITLVGYGINEKPNLDTFSGTFQQGMYPTTTGVIYRNLFVALESSISLKPKKETQPQNDTASSTFFSFPSNDTPPVPQVKKSWWNSKKQGEKAGIIIILLVLIVFAVRKFKFK